MAQDFYPFVETSRGDGDHGMPVGGPLEVRYPARIAVYDDAAATPRVVVIEPQDVRGYLDEITATVSRLAKEQGSPIPFMVIREIVENFIHALFRQPTISILDEGATIRFSDQGPGIREKDRALEFGTTSATEEMRRYIRGVGSGLPYVQQYMEDKGGSLSIDDNMDGGTVVTLKAFGGRQTDRPQAYQGYQASGMPMGMPAQTMPTQQQSWYQQAYPPQPWQAQQTYQPYAAYGGAPPAPRPEVRGAGSYQGVGPSAPPAQADLSLDITERGRMVLSYLSEHQSVGPTDLMRTYGHSQPTWTRELQALEQMGLISKRRGEQKRSLTASGRAIVGTWQR